MAGRGGAGRGADAYPPAVPPSMPRVPNPDFASTGPRVGSDIRKKASTVFTFDVSIHAPAWGATPYPITC